MITSNQFVKPSFTKFSFLLLFFFSYTLSFSQTPCENGMANNFECEKITLMSHMSLSELGASAANDIWGWTSPNTHREYAIVGLNNGYAFVDMTDPVNPVKIGNLPTSSGNSTWGDLKVDENYAYLVSESNGHHIQVFDLLQLDAINNPPIIFDDYGLVTIGSGNAHNMVVDEESNYIYSVGTRSLCSGGPVAFDLSDPSNPTLAGCFSADGYSHDAMCFVYKGADVEHLGKQICIGFNENTFTVVDITDKNKPVELSKAGYENVSYTHQGWMTDDHRYLLLNDEADEQDENVKTSTYLFDLTDLDNPVYLNTHFGQSNSIDHNLYVKGNYAYEANYAEGLRIKDMSDIANGNLTEVAYMDFFPSSNVADFFSVWSSYPYFKSGNIPVSDFEEGLYIVQPQLPHFAMDLPDGEGIQEICAGENAVFEIDLTAYAGFTSLVNLSVSGIPAEASAVFSDNDTSPNGSSTLTISNLPSNSKHSFLLSAIATDSPSHEIAIGAIVRPTSGQPSPISPVNQATELPNSMSLSWDMVSEFVTYDVEVATDASFSQIVFSKNSTSDLGCTVNDLAPNTTYHWRVATSPNPCNQISPKFGNSTPQTFTTANFDCIRFTNPTTLEFPLLSPTILSLISVNSSGTISDLNISDFNMTHPNIGNLEVTLTSPALTQVTLLSSPSGGACDQDNILASFNDSAYKDYDSFNSTCDHSDNAAGLPWTTYAIEDTYQAMNSLSAFNGEEMQGVWVLSVTDLGIVDGGALNEWTLDICTSEGIVLDFDLLNFKAQALEQSIMVSWETGIENNQHNYQLQRSLLASSDFATIATIEANNNKQFKYEDKTVKTGITYYYRLLQVDEAGKKEESNIVHARVMSKDESLQLIPNPATDAVQVILHGLENNETAKISLISLNGQFIQEKLNSSPTEYLSLKGLASGIYLVKVQMKRGVIMKRLVVK